MELKTIKVYVPIDVKDYQINPFQKVVFSIQLGNGKCVKYAHDISEIDTHVLQEQELYIFTKEKLEGVIGDAYCEDNTSYYPKEERRKKALNYINQILK